MSGRLVLSPGSMGLAAVAIELVGVENVVVGSWPGPVMIRTEMISQEDLLAALDLIREVAQNNGVRLTSCEG
jgi:hypothetical protein